MKGGAISISIAAVAVLMVGGCAKAPMAAKSVEKDATKDFYAPTATFQEVMDSVVDPAADQIWDAVSIKSDKYGIHEIKPTTPEDWKKLRRAAIVLIESANLIAVPGRRVAALNQTVEGEALEVGAIQQRIDARHNELAGYGSAMRDIGAELVVAIDKKDVAALTELGGTLDQVCEACHMTFWYPGQKPIDSQ